MSRAAHDVYPSYPTVPSAYLVPPELQPNYRPGHPIPDDANLGIALADAQVGAGRGETLAIIHHESGRTLTYRDLAHQSARLANAFTGMGVLPGHRIAFRLPNCPEAIVTALAAWKCGAVVVPLPMQARATELRYFLEDTAPHLVVACLDDPGGEDLRGAARACDVPGVIALTARCGFPAWSDVLGAASDTFAVNGLSSDGLAVIWHTGGTTGAPKACYHTQRRFLMAGASIGEALGVRSGERWAAAAPLGHALGFIYHTIYTLLHGATIVLVEGFSQPDVLLNALSTHRVDTFTAIAATWGRLNEAVRNTPSASLAALKRGYAMWQSASSTAVQDAWRERGITLWNNFGSTAFATWVLAPRRGDEVPMASLGRAAPGYEVIVVEPEGEGVRALPCGAMGRMAVRGPTGLTYWNRPALQARDVVDGWTLVDDLIQFDEAGNAAYFGRTDFIISTAGHKVAPVEVESVLALHPAVREVAVIGAPDPERQEVVAAFIALNPGHSPDGVLCDVLQAFVKARLSPYKYPRRIEFVDALPRDHVGKVQPKILKSWLVGEGRG